MKADINDFIIGSFITQGELSVYVSSWVMLTKSLQPLPDKYHGLTDVSKRYRLRHLDMIVNPEVRNVFRARAKITSLIRQMLDSDSFLEVKDSWYHSNHNFYSMRCACTVVRLQIGA